MNRTVKKIKLEGNNSNNARKTGYIHSGHYMTSCLHDNENDDDTVEMPIASPDATNNEVTAAAEAELETSASVKSASTTALSSGAPNSHEITGVDSVPQDIASKSEIENAIASVSSVVNGETNTTMDVIHKNRRLLLKSFRNSTRPNFENNQAPSLCDESRNADNNKVEGNGKLLILKFLCFHENHLKDFFLKPLLKIYCLVC